MKKTALFFLFLILGVSAVIRYTGDRPQEAPLPASKPVHLVPDIYADLEGYQDILDLQDAFVRNARQLKPTVVSINQLVERPKKSITDSFLHKTPEGWYSKFKNWLWGAIQKKYTVESLGSGVIYDNRGYILTNYHVIENAEKIMIQLMDRREFSAKIVGVDPLTDLAVLKVFSFGDFPVPAFGSAENLGVGEWVMAIGNPYGLDGTVTVGVVSGKGRSDLGIATFENFIQTDASINPGNSGGPLIDLNGRVVGINTAIAEIGSGVGFAIPMEMAVKIANSIIEKGGVERGWLGVGIQSLTPELATSFQVRRTGGVLVNSIDDGAPADKAGLHRGDIIISFDGKSVMDS
ncbi:MAG: trypsin-like serine protease, partial [Nitrospinaceae bacterium]|nr:trypsin-like serine protease [Nitrospinaceae bacterium]NIR54377.1 trypsin-like serine protease [Nitrospinaceae bacterium]NIT81596.1 trypsin-like serine protease [Nitrospinaceae bacterium]NIX34002.1 trypsin-like serine protease [Nitrospinaceae bacterium]NIY14743.1 trypsin-like serine protease [Nitrospinaceae bacterium]